MALDLELKANTRKSLGQAPFTALQLETEAIQLEELRARLNRSAVQQPAPFTRGHVNHVYPETGEVYQASSMDQDEVVPPDEFGEVGEEMEFVINAVRQMGRNHNPGQKFDRREAMKKAIAKINEKRGHARMASARPVAQGPPDTIKEAANISLNHMKEMSNVPWGNCFQCGEKGHRLGQLACGLRGKEVTFTPCAKCQIGLHSADDCPRQFNSRYANPEPATGALNAQ